MKVELGADTVFAKQGLRRLTVKLDHADVPGSLLWNEAYKNRVYKPVRVRSSVLTLIILAGEGSREMKVVCV